MEQVLMQYFDVEATDDVRDAQLDSLLPYFESKDEAEFLSLIKNLDAHLTSTDESVRGRATQLIVDLLGADIIELSPLKVHHLFLFFLGRIEDYPSLMPSVCGVRALLANFGPQIDRKYGDCYQILKRIFDEVNVQSIAQSIRSEVMLLVTDIFKSEAAAETLQPHAADLIEGVLTITNGERDPRCLVKALHLLSLCLPLFPSQGKVFGEKLFDSAAGYFPIMFRPPPDDKFNITTAMLVSAVENVFCSHSEVAQFTVPLMTEKLSSTDVNTDGKLDAMHCLVRLSRGFSEKGKGAKIDHLRTMEVFDSSLPRLAEILLEIITSNAAGDEGEDDVNPSASKNSIVHGALECVTAVCALISRVHEVDAPRGMDHFEYVIAPMLKACAPSFQPSGKAKSLPLNSLSGLSAIKIVIATARASYWFFSIILVRFAAPLLKDIDTSMAAACTSSSHSSVSSSSFQLLEALLGCLDSSVNYSNVIMRVSEDSDNEISSSSIVRGVCLSILSRVQRALFLLDDRRALFDANWEVLSEHNNVDLWMDTVAALDSATEGEEGGGCCGGASSSGSCCQGGGEENGGCCVKTESTICKDTKSLALVDSPAAVCTFLSSAMKCLERLLTVCPPALYPMQSVEAIYTVVLKLATTLTIHRPDIGDAKDTNAVATSLSSELRVLQGSSISLLCFLYSDGIRSSSGFNDVTTSVVENLFGALQGQQHFEATVGVLQQLSATERENTKGDLVLTKRLLVTLVSLLSDPTRTGDVHLSCLKIILEVLCESEVKFCDTFARVTGDESDFEVSVQELSSDLYAGSVARRNTSKNSFFWLAPASRYSTPPPLEATEKRLVDGGSVTVSDAISRYFCSATVQTTHCGEESKLTLLRSIVQFALQNSMSPGVAIVYEVSRVLVHSLVASISPDVNSEEVIVGLLQDLLAALPPQEDISSESMSRGVTIVRLAVAIIVPLRRGIPVFAEETHSSELTSRFRDVLDRFVEVSFTSFARAVTQTKCLEVSAWFLATVVSKLPHKSARLQDILFRVVTVVRDSLGSASAATDLRSAKCATFGAMGLLVWVSRALFLRLDVVVSVAALSVASPTGGKKSFTWQQLFLDNIFAVLLTGKLSDRYDIVTAVSSGGAGDSIDSGCSKRALSRLPGGRPLHFAASSHFSLSSGFARNDTPVAAQDASMTEDSVDMDVSESAVIEAEVCEFMKFSLSLRMAVLAGETRGSGFILTSYGDDTLYTSAIWKQKMFHRMFPPLSAAVLHKKEESRSSKDEILAVWALCGLLTGTPYTVLGGAETKQPVLKILVCALGLIASEENTPRERNALLKAKSAALVTLEDIFVHEQPALPIIPYLSTVVPELLKIFKVAYAHPAVDRARACRCLLHLLSLPYSELHAFKPLVLKGLRVALDDPKRAVRILAVKVRNEWTVASGVKDN